MLLNTTPQNEAILSNVGEIGDFKIKASAKAFSILSSGLYANKICAIVRELSCNAVDSHVAAGKADTPFDVHLPNQLEPHFSIRDYGTGLTHEQVTSIYTTYFESTKTNSNDYIGALGLGSKSPFAYTDNFTVTAIKDGRKGIYTAFINEHGVPSIALMMEEETADPAGVEVKFSVNDHWDFSKFRDEAQTVYKWFKLKPVVSGVTNFEIPEIDYESKDIIPGVHSVNDYGSRYRSTAVMGNIAYPIAVPEANAKDFGSLVKLLNCGLVIEFAIGELDFQASREGLSYVPQTIESIKRKLSDINNALTIVLAKEADAITNLWDRATFLSRKKESALWAAAVEKYVTDNKLPTWNYDSNSYGRLALYKFEVKNLAKDYNITLRCFTRNRGSNTCTNVNPDNDYDRTKKDANGHYLYTTVNRISVERNVFFIINDTNVGATERAKYHFRNTKWEKDKEPNQSTVYVIEATDKTKVVDTKAFFDAINNPPIVMQASTLLAKPRRDTGLGKNVTILKLQEKGYGGYYSEREMVWRDAGVADSFDATTVYYYLPLKGFEVQSKYATNSFNVKQFYNDLKDCGISSLKQESIYGVRKGDIEFIKTQKNWVNIEDHIVGWLKQIDNKLTMSLVLQRVDSYNLLSYNSSIVEFVASNSPYRKLVDQFKGFDKIRYSEESLKNLCRVYAKDTVWNPQATVEKFEAECNKVYNEYPLLQYLRSAPCKEVRDYINMIDQKKGVK